MVFCTCCLIYYFMQRWVQLMSSNDRVCLNIYTSPSISQPLKVMDMGYATTVVVNSYSYKSGQL